MQYDSIYDENGPGYFDYNPIHALWYILVSRCGWPEERLNSDSFLSAAITVFNENKGISGLLDRDSDAKTLVIEILQHVGGSLLWGSDAKLHVFLLREDYTIASLPVVNQSVMLGDPVIDRASWPETYGEIKVQYNERIYLGAKACIYYYEHVEILRRGRPYIRNHLEMVEVLREGRPFIRNHLEFDEVLRGNIFSAIDDIAICWDVYTTTTT